MTCSLLIHGGGAGESPSLGPRAKRQNLKPEPNIDCNTACVKHVVKP